MPKQDPWNEYEAVILLDSYLKTLDGRMSQKEAIRCTSETLRAIAVNSGKEIDDIYRNIAGITFQMKSMESAYLGYTLMKPASKLFQDVVKLWKENREEYMGYYRKALIKAGKQKASEIEQRGRYKKAHESLDTKTSEDNFYKWLSAKVSTKQMAELYVSYSQLNEIFLDKKTLEKPLLETDDISILSFIRRTIEKNNLFRTKYAKFTSIMTKAIRYYISYVQEKNNIIKVDQESLYEESEKANSSVEEEMVQEVLIPDLDKQKNDFLEWMESNDIAKGTTAKLYISSLALGGKIALNHNIISKSIFDISDFRVLEDALEELLTVPEFIEINQEQYNRCKVAWEKYVLFRYGWNNENAKSESFDDQVEQNENGLENTTTLIREDIKEPQESDLYMRLKSLASVYDDVNGFDIEWIRIKLGLSLGSEELKNILDEIPWAIEVEEGKYSFSKNARPRMQFDKESFEKVLMMRYQNGMQMDSIDLENFRDTYEEVFDEKLNLTDTELENCIRKSGIIYKDRVFPAEGIVNNDVKAVLMEYVSNSFASGNQVLYYKSIYSDLADVFKYCFNLTDAMMLKPYLEYVCNTDEYYFTDDYIAKEKDVHIDHSVEVEDYMLAAGKPLSYEEIYAGLSHVSKDIVYGVIKTSHKIILNAREHYFHEGIFEFSSEDADRITDFINHYIEEDGYCIWSLVFEKIQEYMPIFIENNVYLSSLGIRNAVARKLSGRFHFDGEVISRREEIISMADVYRLYGKHHAPFSDDDLYAFSKEINGGDIYFNSLSETTVRVSKNLFVSRDDICFDVEATDNAISTYLETGYMLIKDIDSFMVFPNVGYEWNVYLLETYLMYFSKKYSLSNNGRSLNNVAGAVVRRGSGFDDFADVCADAIAKSGCELTNNKALDYLGEVNLLTRKSYKKIDSVLVKAKQIRNRKE